MIDVTVSREIPRDAASVAAFLFDPRNDPKWIGGLVEVEPPPGRLAPGTRVHRIAKFMGRRIDYVLEVQAIEHPRLLDMKSVKAPFPMHVRYGIEAVGEGSARVSLTVGGGPGGPARLFHPLMARMVRRNLRADLERLARAVGE